MNYGISAQHTTILKTKCTRAQIDYLALNDGLEEDTKPSPKKKKRVTHRPKGGPSTARIAAQKSMSSPESESRIPLSSSKSRSSLTGVPVDSTDPPVHSSTTNEHETELSGVPEGNVNETNTDLASSAADAPLSGIPPSVGTTIDEQILPDLVVNRGTAAKDKNITSTSSAATAPELQQYLEAANVLLSLHDDVRDDTLDEADEDDNAALMPIGGIGAAVDVAPQEIRLDQPNVDAAIAEIVQNELNQEETAGPIDEQNINPPDCQQEEQFQDDQDRDKTNTENTDSKTEKDVPDSEPKKGSLRMKGYGLKRKQVSRRTFKCTQCDSVKSSIQKLNAHHKRHHPPQMCGICGRTFTLAASLTRHMYDHQELKFKCEHCAESFHFESELISHKIKHRNKNVPSFQCMKSKCGKWFMRKWDQTLHLQKHDKEKHYCDYEGCEFWTNTSKGLNEHKKSHSDDYTHVCKICGKGFKYRSGLKRHRDNDHNSNQK